MFKTTHNSVNISPIENTGKIMFGCGPKYLNVYCAVTIGPANELHKSNTKHNSVNSSVNVQN